MAAVAFVGATTSTKVSHCRGFRMQLTLWLLSIALIAGMTTMPWSNYVAHPHWDHVRWIPFYPRLSVLDIVGNVALFIPFGFFFSQILRGSSLTKRWALLVIIAATLSTAVELFQVYSHNRTPSTTDICTNLLGAILGLAIHRSIVMINTEL
jgi:glycopeptide antibiotics resistance protein